MPRLEWLPVARWELIRMLKRADFLISTLLVPVLAIGGGFVANWAKSRGERERHRVAIVQPAGDSVPPPARVTWVTPPTGADDAALERMVAAREVDAALRVPSGWLEGESLRVLVRRGTPGWVADVKSQFAHHARLRRAAVHGLDSASLASFDRKLAWSDRSVLASRISRSDRLAAFGLLSLMMLSVFTTGMYMAVGISGEKQQRVTEVVVSAIRPQSWMDGKIVAYASVGILQAALWGVSLAIFAGMLGLVLSLRINLPLLGAVLAFAMIGFVQFCALFALVMATVKDLQSTQKLQAYLFFVPMIPFFFAESALRTPDAPWVMALSHFPLFSPMLLPMRMMLGATQAWEAPVALLVLLGTTMLLRRAAGEAFRIGMLMYGKELTLPELWRWAREG